MDILNYLGRAGRYGAYGKAVTFITEGEETPQFEAIISSYKLNITQYKGSTKIYFENKMFRSKNELRLF